MNSDMNSDMVSETVARNRIKLEKTTTLTAYGSEAVPEPVPSPGG